MTTSRRSPARAYEQAVLKHQKRLVRLTAVRERELANPSLLAELGLPEDLPAETRTILAQTHAASRLGPRYPKRTDYESPNREESPWVP